MAVQCSSSNLFCKTNGLAHRLSFWVTFLYKSKVGSFNGTLFVDDYTEISDSFRSVCIWLVGWLSFVQIQCVYLKSIPHYNSVSSFQDWNELWLDEAFWHILFVFLLGVIMFLWRPNTNSARYGYRNLCHFLTCFITFKSPLLSTGTIWKGLLSSSPPPDSQ